MDLKFFLHILYIMNYNAFAACFPFSILTKFDLFLIQPDDEKSEKEEDGEDAEDGDAELAGVKSEAGL